MTSEDQTSKSWFLRFFSNPIVGVTGSLASIVGVILAVYFFTERVPRRELVCFVHPVKSIVVTAGQASRLSVTMDGNEIATDLTAAQIAVWNRGEQSIKLDNVLQPLVIHTEGGEPIVEARIRKSSRDVVKLGLDRSRLQEGELGVTWNILEKNDGGVVQITYGGGPDVAIKADGVIEGQQSPVVLEFAGTIESPTEQYASWQKRDHRAGLIALGFGVAMLIVITFFRIRWE